MTLRFLAPLVLVLAGSTQAEVYRWVDEQGRVHYSDKKPAEAEAKEISDDLRSVNVDDSAQERTKVEQLFRKKTDAELAHEQREQQRRRYQQQKHEDRCARARRALSGLEGRVVFRNADGSEERVSEAERQKRAEAFRRQVERYCPN